MDSHPVSAKDIFLIYSKVFTSQSVLMSSTGTSGQTGLSDGTEARDWGYSGINHDYIQRTYGPWHHHQPEYETSSSHVPPVSYGSSPPRKSAD
ncbi:hypothetical protein PtB15_13B163 [Puccinia triticina]|nr:hypothetical protein PtB15_13B163 [Puccinia triticina]